MEKGISDLLDGHLSSRKKAILNKHLTHCPSCRAHKGQLERLRAEMKRPDYPPISDEYAQDFSSRLKKQLLGLDPKRGRRRALSLTWKWGYGAAGFLLVVFLVLYFTVFTPHALRTDGYFVLSFEEVFREIYSEIGSDPELEELFNSLILASIDEAMGEMDWDTDTFILENPLYRDDITEEDLRILESKIKEKKKL